MRQMQRGFTLVEIAIVLVIIGLLLGGILKGQELITNAKVRNVADQQNGVKAAIYAFQDRFRALPGDYKQAPTNVPNVASSGDGNSQIDANESTQAWHQLASTGFISCAQCSADVALGTAPDATNSPANAFGGIMSIVFDSAWNDLAAATSARSRNNIKSGNQIPSNVLAEVDRKIDDGNPRTGNFRFSTFSATGTPPAAATCAAIGTDFWIVVPNPDANCGGADLL
jgi:prepilin-type N-terminal cleavage/methylation domain-containing protein